MNTRPLQKALRNERGIAAFIALTLVLLLTIAGMVAVQTANDEAKLAINEREESKAFYAAEAGLEVAHAAILNEYQSTGLPPVVMPAGTTEINGLKAEFATKDDGPEVYRELTLSSLAGLHASVKSFSIAAAAHDDDGAGVELSQKFEVAMIPLYQFAVFYEKDLEMHPGADMTFVGRVHSNGDAYYGCGSVLNFQSYVTSASDILHACHPQSGLAIGAGQINIKNTSGAYKGMFIGGQWLDATSGVWYDSSQSRWGGRAQDEAHGLEALRLPIADIDDPRKIIERYNAGANPDSYENLAKLKFIDQKVYHKPAGIWLDVTAVAMAEGWYSTSVNDFTDFRDTKVVDLITINVNIFKNSVVFPANNIVYCSENTLGDAPRLKLINGSNIAKALTWASDNPVYIVGDYNTVNKAPSSIIADAVTILSTSFEANKLQPLVANRPAVATTVNACLIAGNVPSNGGKYSGGVENLPRLLENWSWGGGKVLKWRGSLVCLWESQQATGTYATTYFGAPKRDWAYDTDLDNPALMPPATPRARSFHAVGWKMAHVGYVASL